MKSKLPIRRFINKRIPISRKGMHIYYINSNHDVRIERQKCKTKKKKKTSNSYLKREFQFAGKGYTRINSSHDIRIKQYLLKNKFPI